MVELWLAGEHWRNSEKLYPVPPRSTRISRDVTQNWTRGERPTFNFWAKEWLKILNISLQRVRRLNREPGYLSRYSCGLDGRGSIVGRATFFSTPQCPDRLWGPPSLPSSGHRVLFPRGQSGRPVKLTIHLHLAPRSRKRGSIPPLPHMSSWRSA
jgi:hypothetical protein